MLLVQGTPSRAATKIMPGTIIPVELAKTLDAKKVKAGDKIEAKIVVDLLSDGQVIIPKGAKITGHISDAKARSKDSKDSMVGIVFDQLSTKEGGDLTKCDSFVKAACSSPIRVTLRPLSAGSRPDPMTAASAGPPEVPGIP